MKTPILSVEEVRELDKRATEEYGIPSLLLMENAGRGLSIHVLKTLQLLPKSAEVLIICGSGNNGGDGFVAARHLSQEEVNVTIFLLADPDKLKGDAAINFTIIQRLGIPLQAFNTLPALLDDQYKSKPLIVLDALLGTGFKGELKSSMKDAIKVINELREHHSAKVKVVAVDIPSGLNGDTGPTGAETVMADITVTFACLKRGLVHDGSRPFTGKMEVVDIGIPQKLTKSYNPTT